MQAPEELTTLLTEPHVYTHSARRKAARVLVLVGIIPFLMTTVAMLVSRQNIFLFLASFVEVLYFVALGYIVSRSIRRNFLITGQEGIIFRHLHKADFMLEAIPFPSLTNSQEYHPSLS